MKAMFLSNQPLFLGYASINYEVDIFIKILNMKSLQEYISVIRPDNNGTFVAYVPAILV
jgi:hypothetical protein